MPTPRTPDEFDRGEPLTADDFREEARHVAPALLGTLLLVDPPGDSRDPSADAPDDAASEPHTGPVGGLIVETEAYVNGVDPAAHLAAGRTPRTATFFSGPGTVYVYSIHGHHALNFVTVSDGYPEGVLVRALEPTRGLELMRERRGFDAPGMLTAGPGRLTEALGITTAEFDDRPLGGARLSVYETDLDPEIAVSGRIGVSEAADWPLRYTVADSGFVSRPVPTEESLDHDAVDRCYDRLCEDEADAHTLD